MNQDERGHVALEELSAFADSDLDAVRQRQVEKHLRDCTHCESELRALTSLREGLADLGDVRPRSDLSLELPVRTTSPGSIFAWLRTRWMVPAAALAGAAAALLIVRGMQQEPPPRTTLATPAVATAGAALAAVGKAAKVYRRAIANLEQALRRSRPAWTPSVHRTVKHGLAEIDQVLAKCRAALRQNPHDVRAQRLMLAAYQQKVDLLSDLVQRSI